MRAFVLLALLASSAAWAGDKKPAPTPAPTSPTSAEQNQAQGQLQGQLQGQAQGQDQQQAALDAYPRPIENSELRKLTGYSPRSGTFDSIRGKLNAMGLVDYSVRGHTVAHPLLFPITLLERKS